MNGGHKNSAYRYRKIRQFESRYAKEKTKTPDTTTPKNQRAFVRWLEIWGRPVAETIVAIILRAPMHLL